MEVFFNSHHSRMLLTRAPCSHSQLSNPLTLCAESLPPEPCVQLSITRSRGDRNKCSVPGILYNTNTLEGFQALDKQSLLKAEAKKICKWCWAMAQVEGLGMVLGLNLAELPHHPKQESRKKWVL
ncbi:hypothetical protein HYC85_013448 [Camellia sinensis]|uniref:Ubiquitin-like modifier-activating enzyme Atg7 N-terminal domain-containing protein n=1 Tax=Camellia sinensis TaxID=4442 RepID=A0A7J7H5G5_CAMSI|nr:hypothetical protein HYC85_013448 [Camellia sinensis]